MRRLLRAPRGKAQADERRGGRDRRSAAPACRGPRRARRRRFRGDARALLLLGGAYDPSTLGRMGALGLKGDAGRARDYYARALSAGVDAARQRIAALEAQPD